MFISIKIRYFDRRYLSINRLRLNPAPVAENRGFCHRTVGVAGLNCPALGERVGGHDNMAWVGL